MKSRKIFSPDQMETLQDHFLTLPVFYTDQTTEEVEEIGPENAKYYSSFGCVDLGELTHLGIPEVIYFEKINADGTITAVTYSMSESYLAHESNFHPQDN